MLKLSEYYQIEELKARSVTLYTNFGRRSAIAQLHDDCAD